MATSYDASCGSAEEDFAESIPEEAGVYALKDAESLQPLSQRGSISRPASVSTFRSNRSGTGEESSPMSARSPASAFISSLEAENCELRKRIAILEARLGDLGVNTENLVLDGEIEASFSRSSKGSLCSGGTRDNSSLMHLDHLNIKNISQSVVRANSNKQCASSSSMEKELSSSKSKLKTSPGAHATNDVAPPAVVAAESAESDSTLIAEFQHRRATLRLQRSVERQASLRLVSEEGVQGSPKFSQSASQATPRADETQELSDPKQRQMSSPSTPSGSGSAEQSAKESEKGPSETTDTAATTETEEPCRSEAGNQLLGDATQMRSVSLAALELTSTSMVPIHHLPRGGVHLQTAKGAIQFGVPPETIKDSMCMGLEIPQCYIVPKDRFSLRLGINMCEAEFPLYFNFFIKQSRMSLVSTPAVAEIVRAIIVETLEGPAEQHFHVDQEYAQNAPLRGRYSFAARPDHVKEVNFFKEPRDGRAISADSALSFVHFLPWQEHGDTISQGAREVALAAAAELPTTKSPRASLTASQRSSYRTYLKGGSGDSSSEIGESASVMNEAGSSAGATRIVAAAATSSASPEETLRASAPIMVAVLGNGLEIVDTDDEYVVLDDGVEVARLKTFLGSWAPPQPIMPSLSRSVMMPPPFGITVLGSSHGFDAQGSTSGFVLWINRKGIMIDPPPNATEYLQQAGIVPSMINGIILTHCHADHDAGTFQKILKEGKTTLITTKTIYDSFIRKYALISGFGEPFLQMLFENRLVKIGEEVHWGGGTLRFFYSLHALPCIGFEATVAGKRFVYSADTFYEPDGLRRLRDQNYLSPARCEALIDFPWDCDVILHEAGIPPIHTPLTALQALPEDVKKRLYIIHIAKKSAEGCGLRLAQAGVEHTIEIPTPTYEHAMSAAILQLLRSTDIFRHFTIAQASDLLQLCQRADYKAGEYVCREGDLGTHFYVLLSGFCKVQFSSGESQAGLDLHKDQRHEAKAGHAIQLKTSPIGRKASGQSTLSNVLSTMGSSKQSVVSVLDVADEDEHQVKEFGPGDYFGELALLTDNGRRSADIVASTDLTVVQLDKYAFRYLLDTTPGLEYRMDRLSKIRCSLSWKAIGANSVLSRLASKQRSQLQSVLQVQHAKAGTKLWTKNLPASSAYLLASGKVEILELRESIDEPFRAGAFFCNIASLMSNRQAHQSISSSNRSSVHSRVRQSVKIVPSRITLVAKTDVDLYFIDADDILEFLDHNPGVLINLIDSVVLE